MTRPIGFSSPLLLGFEEIERLVDRLTKAADGYPPYNIERIAGAAGKPARLRIVLAVAGFAAEDIEVTVQESELEVRGRRAGEEARDYLHRGIATREFRRTFVLADGLEIVGAELQDGLLTIELVRPEAVKVQKRIPIATPGPN